MRLSAFAGAHLAFMTMTVSAAVAAPLSASVYAASCRVDGEIPNAERATADTAALSLVQNLLAGNSTAAFAQMTQPAQAATTASGLSSIEQYLKIGVPYQDVRVAHTYLIGITRVGSGAVPPLHCGKSLNDPEAVILSVAPVPLQFDVEVTAHSRNNDWSAFVTLVPDKSGWKAASFHIAPSAMSGRSARDLGQLARAQLAKGHKLSAGLLYRAAQGLADRGPNAAPVWKQDLNREAAASALPAELQGGPPFRWRMGDQIFDVANASIIGIGGAFSLMIERRTTSWPDNATADRDARSLTTAIVKAHPELSDVFAGVIVRFYKPDGSGGFGTVYEFGKGFDGPAPR
jgi:hypothetical protein